MKWWDNLRKFFYRRNIESKLSQISPVRVLTNLHDAKTIGIIYDGTESASDTVIAEFAEQLRQQGKTVEVLSFVNAKQAAVLEGVTTFCKTNLSWNLTPKDERVENFASQDFDLLFAAYMSENLPLEYIARTSNAKWRLGIFDEKKTDYYDMMIKTGDNKDVQYFLDQSTYFLNKIQYDSK